MSFRFNYNGYKYQSGYSIVEWMIVIMLTLFLTAGLLTVFVSSQRATTASLSRGEMQENATFALQLLTKDLKQENATFALQLLTKDLKQAYFFAQATGENRSLWDLNGASLLPSLDCLDDINSGTFPSAGQHRQLWASTVPATLADLEMSCINDSDSDTSLITGSAFISIKRARGEEKTGAFNTERYYLQIQPTGIKVYLGGASDLITGIVSPVWQYMHHVYYLEICSLCLRLIS